MESPEFKTLRSKFTEICGCIFEADLELFAGELFQYNFIENLSHQAAISVSGRSLANKVAHLVSEAMSKASNTSETFRKFVSIIERRNKELAASLETEYKQQVQSKEVPLHQALDLATTHPQRPGKPHTAYVTHNSLLVYWERPLYAATAEKVKSYTIAYRSKSDPPDRWITQTTSQLEPHTELTDLAAHTSYDLRVRADSADGVSGPHSELSNIETSYLRLADKMISHCSLSQNRLGGAKVYLLPTHETMRNSSIVKLNVGQPHHVNHKVLMLVGTAKTGKTTMITAIANYIMGVNWEDKYRFKLNSEENGQRDQNKRRTKCITVYTFHKEEGSRHPYTLTVIDTPGFENTEDLENNKKIVRQIKELLYLRGHEGIDHLDGIGFITSAAMPRLSRTQRYVFESVLSVFGKDVADNIFLLVTFADEKRPPVLDAAEAAGIPFSNHFKLDNSAFCENSEPSENEENNWRNGRKKLEEFFNHFSSSHAQSLQQSREVLQECAWLEETIHKLQSVIELELTKIDELQQERQLLKACEADANISEKYTYQTEVTNYKIQNILPGEYTTNCLTCNYTCHYPCPLPNNIDNFKCLAMDNPGSIDATCSKCPGKCTWKVHVNRPYKFATTTEQETRTSDELKARYEIAMTRKSQVEAAIKKMEEELKEMDQKLLQKIKEAKQCLKRLQEIALQLPSSSIKLNTLIDGISEQQEAHSESWNEREKILQNFQSELQIL